MEDSDIIQMYFSRDAQAVHETQAKYEAYCNSIAKNILGDFRDVEEAVSQTWFEAWKSIPPQQPVVFSSYLGGITRNISLNMLRSRSALKRQADFAESYDELDNLIGSESIEDNITTKELAEAINSFIGGLPEIQRKIFVCRYWYFESIEDICSRFRFSKGKVKSILHRIRKNLQKHLEKEELL